MSWSKFDDQFYLNPKNAAMDRDEQDLYFASIIYANGQLTDGFIPAGVLMMLCIWAKIEFEANAQASAQAIANHLIEHGYWENAKGGFQIHDFLDWNPSRAEILALREARSEAGKRGGQKSARKRAEDQASAQAQDQASAQANSEQNPTPSQYLFNTSSTTTAPPAAFSLDPQCERVYTAVTKQICIPSTDQDKALAALRSIIHDQGGENEAIVYLQEYFKEWKDVRHYSTTNTGWLTDWAAAREIPPIKERQNGKGKQDNRPPVPTEEERKREADEMREAIKNARPLIETMGLDDETT